LISDTKELSWTTSATKGGLVAIETERSTAAIGFVRAFGVALRYFSLRVQNRFAAVTLGALDDRPIAGSERLLLTAGAMAANTGGEWNEDRSPAEVGAFSDSRRACSWRAVCAISRLRARLQLPPWMVADNASTLLSQRKRRQKAG
jgi:hypothetical protein